MKKNLLFALLLVAFANARAQYPKWIVQFTNKQTNTNTIGNPSPYLSAKAIARRSKFNIAIDSTDLPVTQRYIDSVKSKGTLTVLSQSKWLNQILIYCTDATVITKIQALPFVKSAKQVGMRMIATDTIKFKSKFNEQATIIPAPSTAQRTNEISSTTQVTAGFYGNAYAQVHVHNGEYLHNKGYRGQGMTIAILDAGFYQYLTHPAFDSLRINNQILGIRDYVDYDNSVNEDNSHGLNCLSIIGSNVPGTMVGTAPKANFYLIRTEQVASEYPTEEHNWVVGAEFADSAGADMISSSLGYNQFDDSQFDHTYADFYKNSTTVTQGATFATKKGMIVTNSAGNEGTDSWKYLIFPSDADSVCTVGAVDTLLNVAPFSSYGYPGKVKPNVASVGWNTAIATPSNGFGYGSGTSYSNPNINGLIACLWQAFPQYNNMKILDALYKSCPTYATPDNRIGFGIPDMKAAYRSLKLYQDQQLYGSTWLFATPNPFTTQIDVLLVGQIDGTATLQLLDANSNVIATKVLTTEIAEVYNYSFLSLGGLPAGNYSVKYIDANKSMSIPLTKTTVSTITDWLVVYPVPFDNQMSVYLKAPESGKASLRLIDMAGHIIETIDITETLNTVYTLQFTSTYKLAKGVYQIQYNGTAFKKDVSSVKL
jgi:subtilisin family serine protease